jgi:hypothetical protein
MTLGLVWQVQATIMESLSVYKGLQILSACINDQSLASGAQLPVIQTVELCGKVKSVTLNSGQQLAVLAWLKRENEDLYHSASR